MRDKVNIVIVRDFDVHHRTIDYIGKVQRFGRPFAVQSRSVPNSIPVNRFHEYRVSLSVILSVIRAHFGGSLRFRDLVCVLIAVERDRIVLVIPFADDIVETYVIPFRFAQQYVQDFSAFVVRQRRSCRKFPCIQSHFRQLFAVHARLTEYVYRDRLRRYGIGSVYKRHVVVFARPRTGNRIIARVLVRVLLRKYHVQYADIFARREDRTCGKFPRRLFQIDFRTVHARLIVNDDRDFARYDLIQA